MMNRSQHDDPDPKNKESVVAPLPRRSQVHRGRA
jgi:hypothetical protein